MRLLKYLNKVEKQIAKESAGRRADIAAIRAHMARNFAYNQAARASMKKQLLAKMAVNARRAQAKFAAQAELANKRNRATIRRSRKTREIMRKNKRAAARSLKIAVLNQQRALAALASATNAKIKQTNSHIAANAAQIRENAKKARKDLEKSMARFDHKMANVAEQAKKGRSKLAAQAAAQDKAFRNFANNKIRAIAASTAAQFRAVRAQMAKDRHHADMMLKAASSRMDAALSANKALQDKRFAKTVKDIADAKKEADARVAAAKSEFKVGLLHLGATVRHQVAKLNSRVTTLQHTVTRNKLEQAKVNRNVHAELMRMVKLGNKRYNEHIKKDKELKSLMAKNKASTLRKMKRMADSFNMQMSKIRKTMKRDRRANAHALKRATNKLYATLAKNAEMQAAANKHLAAATRRARLDAMDALRNARSNFAERLGQMHTVAVRVAKKQQHRINKLTGIVTANAVKDAKGRAMLKSMQRSNKRDINHAISDCIHKGEQRAVALEKKMKNINKKTRAALSAKVSTMISALRKRTAKSIYALNLETKAARAEMRKEIIYAVKSAAAEAKKNLKAVVQWSNGRFAALSSLLASNAKKSAAARAKLSAQVNKEQARATRVIANAVAAQNRALIALKSETAKKIKKSNRRITSYAAQMAANARAVAAQMKSDVSALQARIAAAKRSASAHLAGANAASIARYTASLNQINKSLSAAKKHANNRFGKAYEQMAADRKSADTKMAAAVRNLNDKIAERAALSDVRFSKTVKNIKEVRNKATASVGFARREMTTNIVALTASIKQSESRMVGEIRVVSGEVASNRATQVRINRRVNKEMGFIIKTANIRHSQSKRARGKLRAILNANKAAAAEETAALAKRTRFALAMLRGKQSAYRRSAAKALSAAANKLHRAINAASARQNAITAAQKAALAGAAAAAKGALKSAKDTWTAKLNTLVNLVSSNNKKYESGLRRITGVVHSWKKSAGKDRALMRAQTEAMNKDLVSKIARAVQIGEARAKAIEDRANENIKVAKRGLQTLASEKIESMSNTVFKLVQGNRQKIADNYLSLRASSATAADKIADYVAKGKGRGLGSIGDLLKTVGSRANVKVGKDEGVGAGASSIPLIFSSKHVKVSNPVNR